MRRVPALLKLSCLSLGLLAPTLYARDIDSLRHLQESWPRLEAVDASLEAQNLKTSSSRRLRGLYRNYLEALESVRATLEQTDASDCQRAHLLAIQDLLSFAKKEENAFTQCHASCRASELKLQNLQNLLHRLDEEVQQCLRGAVTRAWLQVKRTRLRGDLALELEHFSNPYAQGATSSPKSRNDLSLGTKLDFGYRGESFWVGLDGGGALLLRKNNPDKWPFSIRNEWIYQASKHAFRWGASWSRDFPYSQTPVISETSYTRNKQEAFLLWKFPSFTRSLALGLDWMKESWRVDAFSQQSWGPRFSYYLMEKHLESLVFYIAPQHISITSAGDWGLWATGVGFLFEEKHSEYEESRLKLGIQDRRLEEEGASLWPDFELLGVGPDLLLPHLSISWFLKLSPEQTPWSVSTLRAQTGVGLKYKINNLIMPFEIRMARDFHRSPPGGRRDDLFLAFSLGPSVQVSKHFFVEMPLDWNRYWILQSSKSPSGVLAAFPQNSYKTYEARLRLKYEF
jgi:hypothetical protein